MPRMQNAAPSSLPALPAHPLVYGSVLDLIGDSPIIELRR